jgi:hypothetical protein
VIWLGNGAEERLAAFDLECRLRSEPEVTRRREDYHRKVGLARSAANKMTRDEVVAALMGRTPSYIRALLETEDERFGSGALADRYAHTFWKDFQ